MERTFNIETLIEDKFITLLSGHYATSAYFETSGVALKRWEDIENADLTPVVKLKATAVTDIGGTANYYLASNIIVDFAVFTSKRQDEDGKLANEIRGGIRNLIAQNDIVASLNQTSGLFVYNNGVLPQQAFDNSDKKLYQKGVSIQIVATTIDI
jgi:hypothetical protein